MKKFVVAALLVASGITAYAAEAPAKDPGMQAMSQMLAEAQAREARALAWGYSQEARAIAAEQERDKVATQVKAASGVAK